jgi:hypothetical protein
MDMPDDFAQPKYAECEQYTHLEEFKRETLQLWFWQETHRSRFSLARSGEDCSSDVVNGLQEGMVTSIRQSKLAVISFDEVVSALMATLIRSTS